MQSTMAALLVCCSYIRVSTQAAFQPALHFSTWSLLLIMLNNNDGRERENQRYSALPLIIDFFVSGIFFGIFFQVYFC